MFKQVIVVLALVACVAAKPGLLGAPLAYTAHAAVLAAPAPVVTATSSQVVARNFNGIAAAPILAPVAPVAPLAKLVAPVPAPLAAPVVTAPHHLAPLAAPVVARYAAASAHLAYAAPFVHPAHYSALPAPLHYAAHSSPLIL